MTYEQPTNIFIQWRSVKKVECHQKHVRKINSHKNLVHNRRAIEKYLNFIIRCKNIKLWLSKIFILFFVCNLSKGLRLRLKEPYRLQIYFLQKKRTGFFNIMWLKLNIIDIFLFNILIIILVITDLCFSAHIWQWIYIRPMQDTYSPAWMSPRNMRQ